ncbi:MAG TPA: transcriptional repressor [Puia sp.]|nr:transcriptional repressor [Puia sp.]
MSNEDILKKNQLSVTESRKKILRLFVDNPGALSHGDIEKKVGEKFDRVTIYRTLQTFLDKGIIHSIPSADNNIHYALCKEDCSGGHHHDDHVHFICQSCGQTACLEDVVIPAVKLPRGFTISRIEMVVSGTCRDCS